MMMMPLNAVMMMMMTSYVDYNDDEDSDDFDVDDDKEDELALNLLISSSFIKVHKLGRK